MSFGIKVTKSPVKKVTLRIRHAEYYTYPMLLGDVVRIMPEAAPQLEQILIDICGGTNGDKMNAAVLFAMVKEKNEKSILSSLPQNAQFLIEKLLVQEIQRESQTVKELSLFIPDNYSLDDLKAIVNSQIEYSELVSIYDYVLATTFTANHTNEHYTASIYYAINHHKEDQGIKNHISENCRNIISSLNQISVLLF